MKLTFLGAAREVTGSSYLLEAGGLKILIDCGMFQEKTFTQRNWDPFPVPPDQIQHLLLTHVHLDHSGLIPKLVKDGFTGDILLTSASKTLLPIVMLDSARMQEEDAAFEQKRAQREGRKNSHPVSPLYTVHDAEQCFPLLRDVQYEQSVLLNDRVTVCFHDAGHILGSAMIELVVQEEGRPRRLIFSGDIGQWNNPLLGQPSVFDQADYVVMESTYGDRVHDDPEGIEAQLSRIVNDTVKAGGNVLIPTFAIERAQELLYHFGLLVRAKKIPPILAFLDSPMAVEITKVFEQSQQYFDAATSALFKDGQSPFEFPGLMLVESVDASKSINQIKGSAVIMAGSGMITGGRIAHHLALNITRPESTLLFVGYQAAGTLGRQIVDGMSPVAIHGQSYPVRMKIETIYAFSSHADMNDLHRWLNSFKSPPTRVFLTHGEEAAMLSLETFLKSKGGWDVSAPTYLEEETL